jgi:hypothetical protein
MEHESSWVRLGEPRQVRRPHARCTHARGLPLADLLPVDQVAQALQAGKNRTAK